MIPGRYAQVTAYNPTSSYIEFRADGYFFRLAPQEEVILWPGPADVVRSANHKSRKEGVVLLNYDRDAQMKYPSYEEYKEAKAEEGLKARIRWAQTNYKNELQAERDLKESQSGGSQSDLMTVKPKKFAKQLKQAEDDLAEGPKKRRGRPRKVESSNDTEQS